MFYRSMRSRNRKLSTFCLFRQQFSDNYAQKWVEAGIIFQFTKQLQRKCRHAADISGCAIITHLQYSSADALIRYLQKYPADATFSEFQQWRKLIFLVTTHLFHSNYNLSKTHVEPPLQIFKHLEESLTILKMNLCKSLQIVPLIL